MKIFGLKVMKGRDYDHLCLTVANAGKMVRKYTSHDGYTNYGQSAKVPLNDLSLVHCIENVIWSDVKDMVLDAPLSEEG